MHRVQWFFVVCISLALTGVLWSAPVLSRDNSAPLASCNKLAVYELKQCLAQFALDDNQHCWSDSHQSYQQCVFAMTNQPGADKPAPASKAQLQQIARLRKQLNANTIRRYADAAAQMSVYKRILAQAQDNLQQLILLPGIGVKQQRQYQARLLFFTQLGQQAEQGVSCTDAQNNLKDFADAQKQVHYNSSAYREIKKLIPIYCRLLAK